MNILGRDIMNMPVDKMQKMFDNVTRVNDSKVFSKSEEKEMKAQLLSFMGALKKCGNGHLVSPEMKPIIKEFEKADFDFNRLPYSLKNSFEKTYIDFKTTLNENNGEFKNSAVSVYCKAYEFLLDNNNRTFLNRIRKDPMVKKTGFSTECFDNIDSLEDWLQNDDQSLEAGFFAAMTALPGTVLQTMATIKFVGVLIAIILTVIVALLIVLVVVNIKYKTELSKYLSSVSDNDIKADPEGVKKSSRYNAAKNMLEKTSPLTKNTLYKPVDFAISSLQKITYNTGARKYIDKMLAKSKNEKFTKEGYEQSQEALEVAVPIIIIVSLILLAMMMKPIVYFIYNLKMKISVFFEEEATMLEINIEELIKQRDAAQTDSERERIDKIISKQRKAMTNMSALSNFFYKQTNDAAIKTREDVSENDSVDYDSAVDQIDNSNNEEIDPSDDDKRATYNPNAPYEDTTKDNPTSGDSIVLF